MSIWTFHWNRPYVTCQIGTFTFQIVTDTSEIQINTFRFVPDTFFFPFPPNLRAGTVKKQHTFHRGVLASNVIFYQTTLIMNQR